MKIAGGARPRTVLHVGLRRGDAQTVDPTVERLLGRPARSLADYVAREADLWRRPGPPPLAPR